MIALVRGWVEAREQRRRESTWVWRFNRNAADQLRPGMPVTIGFHGRTGIVLSVDSKHAEATVLFDGKNETMTFAYPASWIKATRKIGGA